MRPLNEAALVAVILTGAGALYIKLRWRCSPHAYHAMIGLVIGYFMTGAVLGAWVFRHTLPEATSPAATSASPVAFPSMAPPAPILSPDAGPLPGPSVLIPTLHYDPSQAILPDRSLTPGDTFAGVTADDVCTPGWSADHRHVTEAERDRAYAEYARTPGPNCCEVDHLIPLELGGSNDIKNLWPQPFDPRPGDAEKDQLENKLHELVCHRKLGLADAQKCIASNWVECWKKYVVPDYGPGWAAANRHGR